MQQLRYFITLCVLSLLLIACDTQANYAPVTEISHIEAIPKSGVHKVKNGETLYEIAWKYGLDYRYLANLNQLPSPYVVRSQQKINLRVKPSVTLTKKAPSPARAVVVAQVKETQASALQNAEPDFQVKRWVWPAQGRIINTYSAKHKGVNIAGLFGEPIYAAAPGKVVYSGNGLRGYGNLIIIKHNSLYLSAYAHNSKVSVKEGEWVKAGQKIAQMGNTGTDKIILHFEIRRAGKPMDPISVYH